jgi:hypothetical protein
MIDKRLGDKPVHFEISLGEFRIVILLTNFCPLLFVCDTTFCDFHHSALHNIVMFVYKHPHH